MLTRLELGIQKSGHDSMLEGDKMDCLWLFREAQLLDLEQKERCDHEPNELVLLLKVRPMVFRVSPQPAVELGTNPLR